MVFSSFVFICIFLPVVYCVNILLPPRASNGFLLAASLFLYAWGEQIYVLLLAGCIVVNYGMVRLIAKGRCRRGLLAFSIAFNLTFLGIFKYADMAVETVNAMTGAALPLPGISMPIGISFFTFQAMSCVVDVYRGRCKVQHSLLDFALYVSFFPQLIAGPIVKYHEIAAYLTERRVTIDESAVGLRRFSYGLAKKVLIANSLAALVDGVYALDSRWNAPLAWLAAIGYALQIYYDFSGYSDMAIGMGRMFGFVLPENFDLPYASASLRDFWRRWHMSLSGWFRDYLYIPLGGNRKGAVRTQLNRLIVFFLTGLWHGAGWNFVVWGLCHGVLTAFEDLGVIPVAKLKGRARWIGVIYTLAAVTSLFVLFRADTLSQAFSLLRAMFSGGFGFDTAQRICLADFLTPWAAIVLAVSALGASPVPRRISEKLNALRSSEALRMGAALLLLCACQIALAAQSSNPFIYFRF